MRVCHTARRGIFRFKFSYCDRGILRSRLLKALASQDFVKRACAQYLCKPGFGAEFALRRKFNPAARKFLLCSTEFALRCRFNPVVHRFLLCSVKFALLRNDKIYGAIWRRGGVCSAAHLFCGPGFAAADKI